MVQFFSDNLKGKCILIKQKSLLLQMTNSTSIYYCLLNHLKNWILVGGGDNFL